VRGYGLIDSAPVTSAPGREVALQAVLAPTAKQAAQYYPPSSWYSLIKVPDAKEFPGTGPQGNGIAPQMTTQAHWISAMKDGCQLCHQLGNQATREIPKGLGEFATSVEGRCGTGPGRPRTCTMRSPPIAAPRPSTPSARSTASTLPTTP
jgi:hypothetical protein